MSKKSWGGKNWKIFAPIGLILNYSNKCNFQCTHCFTKSGMGDFGESKLTIDDIRSLANQADELGIYEIDIQGVEPLMYPNLFEILEAFDTSRFYIYITTNGWLLTQDVADKLARAGLDRISVSIDAFTAEEHDKFRKKPGSFERCLKALEYTKNAGLKPYVNIVAGSYNVNSKEFDDFCDSMFSNGYGIVLNCASPTGNWRGNYDAMLTPDDTARLEDIRQKYITKNRTLVRDVWNSFSDDKDYKKGCPAVNLCYVNPYGDVLPCTFIHTKLGNIKEQPLKEILEYGFSFESFCTYSEKCLTGEDMDFAKKFLNQKASILNPKDAKDFFYAPKDGWLIQKYKEELKNSIVTSGLADQIDLLTARYGKDYLELSERVLQMMLALNLNIIKIANKLSMNFLKEQARFMDSGDYGHTDYDIIREKVYDNEKVMMEEYMPGIFWAYSTTSLLYTKYNLFKSKFLTRLGEAPLGVEIGFGAGFYIWELFNHIPNAKCSGFDISKYAVNFATKILEQANIPKEKYKLFFGDVRTELDTEAAVNDFAILAEVIEHIPNPREAVKEVNRLLKSGGFLYLTTVKDSNHMDHMTNFKSAEEVEQIITDSGFRVLDKSINCVKDDFPNISDISVGFAFVCEKVN